jgi:uncharacterized membrane protein (DUF106 family)
MWLVLRAITRTFDVLLSPFARLHPLVGISVVSVVTGVVMLLIFGKTSNQKRIAETKDKLKAYIMEMWIFRNDPRVMFAAIGNVVRNNLQYLRHSLRPLIFIIIPVLVIMVQLGIRYGNWPLRPGEIAVVTAELRDGVKPTEAGIDLEVSEGMSVVSPPLRMDARNEVEWKIQAGAPASYDLAFTTDRGSITKRVVVAADRTPVALAAVKPLAGTWDAFLYPSEAPIPRDSIVARIRVAYPQRYLTVFGANVHWLIFFFVVSVAAGFALKGVFGVEV